MVWSKFDLGWPWLCLGGGVALFAVMFGTNAIRSKPTDSRWRDPLWLAWLVVPMLMVHMFEEYAFDILGRTYFLPDTVCKNLGYPPYPDCPIRSRTTRSSISVSLGCSRRLPPGWLGCLCFRF